MTDHKSIAEILKKNIVGKIGFSTSPRKPNRSLWVFKMEATDERVEKLNALIADGSVGEWTIFYSKDKMTTGLQLMVTLS
jgi:hypothetical protein